MKIGLVEDAPSNLDYLQTLLTWQGHQVFAHREAQSFLESVRNTFQQDGILPYDLVLLDLILPGLFSGIDIIYELRGTVPSSSSLPLIIISAASESRLLAVQTSFPTIPILRKPFSIQQLMTLIERFDPQSATPV